MIFNDALSAALAFLILLACGVFAGLIYDLSYIARSIAQNAAIRFLVDFFYVIIAGITFLIGIIIADKGRIEYYHILAEAIGIAIGAIPKRFIKKKIPKLVESHIRRKDKIKTSKFYRKLTK